MLGDRLRHEVVRLRLRRDEHDVQADVGKEMVDARVPGDARLCRSRLSRRRGKIAHRRELEVVRQLADRGEVLPAACADADHTDAKLRWSHVR